jgi:polysaccharide export outer membrane protein
MNRMKDIVFMLFVLGILFFVVNSCGINSDIMFKTPKDEVLKNDSMLFRTSTVYKIKKDDKISFSVEPNEGISLLSSNGALNTNQNQQFNNEFIVMIDGTIQLPVVGNLKVEGLTIRQFEDTLQQLYGKYINKPFVRANVSNKRVIVFPGKGGDARVIPLVNNQTTLLEVLATAGGIAERGKASTVKLMRIVDSVRVVQTIDLSLMSQLSYADVIVLPNDYIYVEPNEDLARETLERISPIIGIVSNILLILSFILTF